MAIDQCRTMQRILRKPSFAKIIRSIFMIRLPSIQSIEHRSTETDVRKKKPAGPGRHAAGSRGISTRKRKSLQPSG
jgi:hypothetical protein